MINLSRIDLVPKLARPQDFEEYYKLRCDDLNINWTGHANLPNKEKLYSWYLENINKENRFFFVFYKDENSSDMIGYLYMDVVGNGDTIDTGTAVHCKHNGKGYGTSLLTFALQYAKDNLLFIKHFQGWIAADNAASIKTVLRNGYYKTDETKEVKFGNGEVKIFEKYLYDIVRP